MMELARSGRRRNSAAPDFASEREPLSTPFSHHDNTIPASARAKASRLLDPRRRSSSMSESGGPAFCAVFLPDNSYKTIQITETVRTSGDVIQIVLEKSNNPRLMDDYRLVIKYADQSDSWLEIDASVDLLLSAVVVKIFLKLALEASSEFCDQRKKRIKQAKKKKPKKKGGKDKQPDEQEMLRDLHNAWFAGKMAKGPTEKAVLSGKHGDYLIRSDSGGAAELVLVVNDMGTICNFAISCNQTFEVGQMKFGSLLEMVKFIKNSPLEGNFGIELELSYPAPGGIVMESGQSSPSYHKSRSGKESAKGLVNDPLKRSTSRDAENTTRLRDSVVHSPGRSEVRQSEALVSAGMPSSAASTGSIVGIRRKSLHDDAVPDAVPSHVNAEIAAHEAYLSSLLIAKKSLDQQRSSTNITTPPVANLRSPSRARSTHDVRNEEYNDYKAKSMMDLRIQSGSINDVEDQEQWQQVDDAFDRRHTSLEHKKNAHVDIQVGNRLGTRGISRSNHGRRSAKDALPRLPGGGASSTQSSASSYPDSAIEHNANVKNPKPRPRAHTWNAKNFHQSLQNDQQVHMDEDAVGDRLRRMSLSDGDFAARSSKQHRAPTARPRRINREDSSGSVSSTASAPPAVRSTRSTRHESLRSTSSGSSIKQPLATPRGSVAVRGQRALKEPMPLPQEEELYMNTLSAHVGEEQHDDDGGELYMNTSYIQIEEQHDDSGGELYMNTLDALSGSVKLAPEPPFRTAHDEQQELYMNLGDAAALQGQSSTDATIDDYLYIEDGNDSEDRDDYDEEYCMDREEADELEMYMNTAQARAGLNTLQNETSTDEDASHGPDGYLFIEDDQELYMNTADAINAAHDDTEDLYMNAGLLRGQTCTPQLTPRKSFRVCEPTVNTEHLSGQNEQDDISDDEQYITSDLVDAQQPAHLHYDSYDDNDEEEGEKEHLYIQERRGNDETTANPEYDQHEDNDALYMAPEMTEVGQLSNEDEIYMAPEIQEKSAYPRFDTFNSDAQYMAPEIQELSHASNEDELYMAPEMKEKSPRSVHLQDNKDELYMAPEATEWTPATVHQACSDSDIDSDDVEDEEDWDDENYDNVDEVLAGASHGGKPFRTKSAIGRSMVRRIRDVVQRDAQNMKMMEDLYETPEVDLAAPPSQMNDELYETPEADLASASTNQGQSLYMTPETAEVSPKRTAVILPSGWVKVYDEALKRDYYFNQVTRQVQWTLPDSEASD